MKCLMAALPLLAICIPMMASSTPQPDVGLSDVSAVAFQRSAAAHLSMTEGVAMDQIKIGPVSGGEKHGPMSVTAYIPGRRCVVTLVKADKPKSPYVNDAEMGTQHSCVRLGLVPSLLLQP